MALVTGDFELEFRARVQERNTAVGAAQRTAYYDHLVEAVLRQANGTGANNQNIAYSERKTLTVAYQIDVSGGAASVLSGANQTMSHLVAIIVRNLATAAGSYVTLGGGTNQISTLFSAAGDSIILGPGGLFVATNFVDGWAITAATADKFQLTPAVNPTDVDILLVGRSP